MQNKLAPTDLGCRVTDFLVQMLPELFDVKFTSLMEGELDEVEAGSRKWTAMMKEFYEHFQTWLTSARDFGAVEGDQLNVLADAMQKIEFAPAEKTGRYVRDDKKFFKSVTSKLAKQGKLTEKQFNALLDLAVNYRSQIPDLDVLAEKGGFADALAEAENRAQLKAEQNKVAADRGVDSAGMAKLFAVFDNVQFAEPTVRRGLSYDDKKFFDSLRQQAESGKILSEKQLEALGKIALRYRDQISDYQILASALNLPCESELAEAETVNSALHDEVAKLIEFLGSVTDWAPAERKGRRTYDDKVFYKSLADQFNSGRKLSDKQLAALKKLAEKYQK